ncbi:hypothetical protein BU23DRAFT_466794 [Bimuria novae-zelandiae CBS 107.79]|uniref:Uncharacterized protein n=1 Tax=Bimuria novae-zelandiae CBS 107.79 TaxID=1447943 RepID=A0A6A5V802_9PLEO|nr:hypothetical protein BU23DRAFT_466794 [Bimuria novae-zelandiae CBS 107.79]
MCTVIHYLYTCGHYISRRPSRCGGTRFKFTRSSRRAACTADGYITIKRITPCSKCLKDIWSAQWEKKLEKARKFHQELAEKKMSGAKEILGLIGELETKCELESWELKNELPYGGNPRVRRVNPVDLDKPKLPASPLRLEVRPEEVVLQVVSEPVYDDDDGWEPSTDPMHPVTTNYEVLCAGIDDDYLEFLTGDMGVDSNLDHEASDLSAGSWDWGGGRLASSPDNQMLEGQSSVVAKYDMFRQDIMPLKAKDPRKFYAQWLVECRLEIREIVGPDGAMVYDPPR